MRDHVFFLCNPPSLRNSKAFFLLQIYRGERWLESSAAVISWIGIKISSMIELLRIGGGVPILRIRAFPLYNL